MHLQFSLWNKGQNLTVHLLFAVFEFHILAVFSPIYMQLADFCTIWILLVCMATENIWTTKLCSGPPSCSIWWSAWTTKMHNPVCSTGSMSMLVQPVRSKSTSFSNGAWGFLRVNRLNDSITSSVPIKIHFMAVSGDWCIPDVCLNGLTFRSFHVNHRFHSWDVGKSVVNMGTFNTWAYKLLVQPSRFLELRAWWAGARKP